jgi:hypothetical protein
MLAVSNVPLQLRALQMDNNILTPNSMSNNLCCMYAETAAFSFKVVETSLIQHYLA